MAEDAPMDVIVNEIEFSEGVLVWLQANRQKLEDMVGSKQKIYNLDEWEEFERWAYSQSSKLQAANQRAWASSKLEAANYSMRRELQKMQTERTDLLARIAQLEDRGETYSSVSKDYRTGMLAIKRLESRAHMDPHYAGQVLRPFQVAPIGSPGPKELIKDRLDMLVARIAKLENNKQTMEAGQASHELWMRSQMSGQATHQNKQATNIWMDSQNSRDF